jgi:tight adherence protein B
VVLIMMVVCLAIFALAAGVIAAMNAGPSKLVKERLQALRWESAPTQFEETTDIRREEPAGRIVWLNRWMVKINIAPRMRLFLHQADVKTSVERLLVNSAAGWLIAGSAIYWRTRTVLPAALLSAVFIPVPLILVFRKRTKRLAKIEQQLPEALDMLVGALRVGHSLVTAIGALGQDAMEPLAGEFRKLFDEQNFGLDSRTAMTNLALRVPLPDVRIFVAASLIQKESGGNLAEVLAKVSQTTRSRFQLRKQIMVHTAQGRLTGWILSLLPVGLGLGMYLVNPDGVAVLWTRPMGLKMLGAAAVMIAVGWLIIQKIVRIRV